MSTTFRFNRDTLECPVCQFGVLGVSRAQRDQVLHVGCSRCNAEFAMVAEDELRAIPPAGSRP